MDLIEEKKKIILQLMNDKHYVPMKFKELVVILNVRKEDRGLLDIVLTELLNEGKITISKKGKYSIPQEEYRQGLFIGNEKGFGFVEVEGEEEDYFIPKGNVNGAFHHDMVLIAVDPIQTGKRKEGKVIKIISHEIREVVGYFQKNKSFGYVIPDNKKIFSDIYIAGKDTKGAVDGHKVVAKIKTYGTKDRKPEGVVTEILGHVNDPGVDILSIVKKNQTDISNIEDQVLSMYAKGMTTRDISAHLKDVYGVDASAEMISHMTDRILPIAKEWQNRPLERKYAIVFMDAVHFHVREDNRTVKKAVYVAIGVKLNGKREVLGMWVGGNESAKYWLSVLNEIKNRGVEDIMIVSVDGLTGFGDAIHAVFPQAEIQRCIVHQIRYSTKFISYKDLKPFMADLKLVYKADTEDLALTALEDLEEKWGKKYPASIGSWRNNWTQLSTYFKYPSEIRKLIYTTNSIENFNRQLRKVTKSKTIFPTDDALFKMLYLAMMDATKKWTGKAWDWGLTLDQLCIYFGDRIQPEDID